jgi:nicotinate-nucleotide--dimethylbenzimidazole phosphoribosyltransferase
VTLTDEALPAHAATDRAAIETARAARWTRRRSRSGALGVLEEVAVRLAALQRTTRPEVERGRIVVFAGDHGVAAEGRQRVPAARDR